MMKFSLFVTMCLFVLCWGPRILYARAPNRKIDSLQHQLEKEQRDSVRARLLLEIGDEYRFRILKHDSGLYCYKHALDLARKGKFYSVQMAAANRVAAEYNRTGQYVEALELSLENL